VGKTVNMIAPFPFLPIPDMPREGVKSFVTAEKALIDTVMQRSAPKRTAKKTPRSRGKGRRAGRPIKIEHATA
jgi:hypothetical protein